MPWEFDPNKTISHGTWAVHDACGRVQKLEPNRGHTECQFSPPDSSSRTHRARQDDRQLLYVVGFEDLLKFGHGDEARISAHLRAGATVIQVVEASYGEVVRAQLAFRRQYAGIPRATNRHMPPAFGASTEVLRLAMVFDRRQALGGDDVTFRFS